GSAKLTDRTHGRLLTRPRTQPDCARVRGRMRRHKGRTAGREITKMANQVDSLAAAELERLEARGLYRRLRQIEGRAGPHMRIDGRDVLMLAGSNTLDLAAHPEVVAAAQAALAEHGVAAGGSRLISGNTVAHDRLEAALARF